MEHGEIDARKTRSVEDAPGGTFRDPRRGTGPFPASRPERFLPPGSSVAEACTRISPALGPVSLAGPTPLVPVPPPKRGA